MTDRTVGPHEYPSSDGDMAATSPRPFGFEIDWPHATTHSWGIRVEKYWSVKLPHQCDAWIITSEADKAAAIAEMEAFISEARAALVALIDKEPESGHIQEQTDARQEV